MGIVSMWMLAGLHTAEAGPRADTEARLEALEAALGELDAQQAELAALEARYGELEARVAELEARSPTRADPSPDQEQAAANLLKEVTGAMERMDFTTARARLDELLGRYGATRAAKAAQRLQGELDIIGRSEHSLDVEKWYQGSAADVEGSKATLYVFWEVWCPHCKREVPRLSETYDRFRSRGLAMVGLTKQTRSITDAQVAAFIDEQRISYPIAREDGDTLSQHYNVRGIPAAAVVKDGRVVWRGHPARLTDEMISSWLGD